MHSVGSKALRSGLQLKIPTCDKPKELLISTCDNATHLCYTAAHEPCQPLILGLSMPTPSSSRRGYLNIRCQCVDKPVFVTVGSDNNPASALSAIAVVHESCSKCCKDCMRVQRPPPTLRLGSHRSRSCSHTLLEAGNLWCVCVRR